MSACCTGASERTARQYLTSIFPEGSLNRGFFMSRSSRTVKSCSSRTTYARCVLDPTMPNVTSSTHPSQIKRGDAVDGYAPICCSCAVLCDGAVRSPCGKRRGACPKTEQKKKIKTGGTVVCLSAAYRRRLHLTAHAHPPLRGDSTERSRYASRRCRMLGAPRVRRMNCSRPSPSQREPLKASSPSPLRG